MKTKLNISSNLSLPLDTVTQTIGILAKRGAGKTYTAAVLAEEFVDAKLPFCVLDPTGAWWGLRVLADGKPGLPVVIIGGRHGDIPLESTAGSLIADVVVDNPGFYVIDMSLFDSNAQQDRFATDFAERLYRRKQQSREPLHLFVDEADSFAPQRPYRGQERMLGAFEALSRRGRIYGIGITLISQRPAVINKNVLSQIEVLISLQTTSPHDRAALEAWAEGHGTSAEVKEFMETLASLSLGEAWIWSPSWLEVFKRVQIRKRRTFNSSATPKIGEAKREPKALAPVDIERLRERMAETIEKIKTDDPRVLHKQIAELKKHKCPEINQNPVKVERIMVPMVGKRTLEGLKTSEVKMRKMLSVVKGSISVIEASVEKLSAELRKVELKSIGGGGAIGTSSGGGGGGGVNAPLIGFTGGAGNVKTAKEVLGEITNPERRILNAIAWFESVGVTEPTKTAVAFLAGYTFGSGGFNNPCGSLRTKGLIEYKSGNIVLTETGRQMAEVPDTALTTEELHKKVMSILPTPEQRVLKPLLESYPNPISHEELAEKSGYVCGSGGFNNPRGRLRTLGLIDYLPGNKSIACSILFL